MNGSSNRSAGSSIRLRGARRIPIETYLRLMFLKYRYGLGYERLCVQVTDSLSWRRFCRIGLEAVVPDESTIRKITRRCGLAGPSWLWVWAVLGVVECFFEIGL